MFTKLHLRWLLLNLLALTIINPISSQRNNTVESPYPTISEDMFKGTCWKYTETYHAASKTNIHKVSEGYEFFITFNED